MSQHSTSTSPTDRSAPGVAPHGRTGNRPREIDTLLRLTVVSAAVHLSSQVVGVLTTDAAQMDLDGTGLSMAQASTILTAGTAVAAVVALALYVYVLRGLSRGRSRSRTLGSVLAVLGVVLALAGAVQVVSTGMPNFFELGLGAVFAVVNILWLITAWRAPVSAWLHRTAA